MPTLHQLGLYSRYAKKRKTLKHLMSKSPQKKGYILKLSIRTPKKPNSAKRKIARAFLSSTKKRLFIGLLGREYLLQRFSVILVRGGRRRDTPGIKYVAIRGVFDLIAYDLSKKRSKYGCKKKLT